MNKTELVDGVAEFAEISKSSAQRAVDGFIHHIKSALSKDDQVTLPGFGSWKVSKRAARKGRNPQTGEEIQIAAKNAAVFKAGKDLKDAVN